MMGWDLGLALSDCKPLSTTAHLTASRCLINIACLSSPLPSFELQSYRRITYSQLCEGGGALPSSCPETQLELPSLTQLPCAEATPIRQNTGFRGKKRVSPEVTVLLFFCSGVCVCVCVCVFLPSQMGFFLKSQVVGHPRAGPPPSMRGREETQSL